MHSFRGVLTDIYSSTLHHITTILWAEYSAANSKIFWLPPAKKPSRTHFIKLAKSK